MNTLTRKLTIIVASTVITAGVLAQSPTEAPNLSPLVPNKNEGAPKLFLGDPLPEPLARGVVLVPYRVENFRILPILGQGTGGVSPRVGHLHVSVDDLPWQWGDFSENSQTIVVVGLPPGQHKLNIALASAVDHHVFITKTVTFTISDPAVHAH